MLTKTISLSFLVSTAAMAGDLSTDYTKAEKSCEGQAAAVRVGFGMRLPDSRADLKAAVEKIDPLKLCQCDFELSKSTYGLDVAAWMHAEYGLRVPNYPYPDKARNAERFQKLSTIATKCVEKLK